MLQLCSAPAPCLYRHAPPAAPAEAPRTQRHSVGQAIKGRTPPSTCMLLCGSAMPRSTNTTNVTLQTVTCRRARQCSPAATLLQQQLTTQRGIPTSEHHRPSRGKSPDQRLAGSSQSLIQSSHHRRSNGQWLDSAARPIIPCQPPARPSLFIPCKPNGRCWAVGVCYPQHRKTCVNLYHGTAAGHRLHHWGLPRSAN